MRKREFRLLLIATEQSNKSKNILKFNESDCRIWVTWPVLTNWKRLFCISIDISLLGSKRKLFVPWLVDFFVTRLTKKIYIFFPSKIFLHSLDHFSFFSLERLLSFLCHLVCLFICLLSLTFCSIDFIHCTSFCHCLFVYLICLSDYLHTHSLFALAGLKFSSCVNFYWPWAGDSPPVHFHLYQIILHSRLLECPFRDLSLGRG